MDLPPEFRAFSLEHLIAIFLTISLPFVLAAIVHRSKGPLVERTIVSLILTALVINYCAYLVFVRLLGEAFVGANAPDANVRLGDGRHHRRALDRKPALV